MGGYASECESISPPSYDRHIQDLEAENAQILNEEVLFQLQRLKICEDILITTTKQRCSGINTRQKRCMNKRSKVKLDDPSLLQRWFCHHHGYQASKLAT